MAERRMFAKSVVLTDKFLNMKAQSKCLYFYLGMLADDDGFVSAPDSAVRMARARLSNMDELVSEQFVVVFPSGVVAIKDWLVNNKLRRDRHTPTRFVQEKSLLQAQFEPQMTTDGPQEDAQPRPQDRTSKDRTSKDNLIQDNLDEDRLTNSVHEPSVAVQKDFSDIFEAYRQTCPSLEPCLRMTENRQEKLRQLLDGGLTKADFLKAFERLEENPFMRGENKTGWRASFDWLLDEGRIIKILEGGYEMWRNPKADIPCGANGHLGRAELEAIQRILREE